jgi:pimeloyl-ACP methyl ester carboxylesterase
MAAVGLGLVALLGLAYLAICGYMALSLTQPDRHAFVSAAEQYGLSYENVEFPSRVDGVSLKGWLLLPAEGVAHRRPVVVVHGKGADRSREAGGHTLDIAASLLRDGHPVLLFDLRGSGQSAGDHFTLGAKEVWDMGGAIDFLAQRGLAASGVDVLGYSMGGATALLDAPGEPLVRAVVEDSAYAELGELIDDQLPRASRLPSWFTPGTVLLARPLVGIARTPSAPSTTPRRSRLGASHSWSFTAKPTQRCP